jgi:hypothetical protein
VQRRSSQLPEQAVALQKDAPAVSVALTQNHAMNREATIDRAGAQPVILLSYVYSGAQQLQDLITMGTELACSAATGILPLCAMAAETWRRIERRDSPQVSQLAAVTIRRLVTAQVAAILADAGKRRWCELAMADPGAAQWFTQVFPHAAFVCAHRNCLAIIRTALQGSSWGQYNPALWPYLQTYPGNSVAAFAAYWFTVTTELLAFEEANPQITRRIRYEDAATESSEELLELREWLRLEPANGVTLPRQHLISEPENMTTRVPEPQVPADLIPQPLRTRVNRLHTELGYAPI